MSDFESWFLAHKNEFSNSETIGMFEDAILCYHADIVRPAYLLSYQAMMIHFRYLILSAKKPPLYDEERWRGVLNSLRSETKWDEMTFTATQQKEDTSTSKYAILSIPDDIRPQFLYWRSIRNDCAHYKGNRIIKAHVQSLWSFIEQYIFTFTVDGGIATLLQEFSDFYNPAKTPSDADITPLLEKIPLRIREEEYDEFFSGMRRTIGQYRYGELLHFMNLILKGKNMNVKSHLILFIKNNDLQERLIAEYPEYVIEFYTEDTEIRELWFQRLNFMPNAWKIFSILLLANKIPTNQIDEACEKMLENFYERNTYISDLSLEENHILTKVGYFNKFVEKYLDTSFTSNVSNMSKICNSTNFYISHLNQMELTLTLVERIIDVFSTQYPYTLHDRIIPDYLKANKANETKLNEILSDNGLTLPPSLQL